MIVTLYSYKGGVGRSMALANIARWFQLRGLRVVMVDWDLEAPGLDTFFIHDAAELEALRSKVGLLDLLVAYSDIFPSLPVPPPVAIIPGETQDRTEHVRGVADVLDQVLPPLSHMLLPIKTPDDNLNGGSLRLLSAGARNGDRFNAYAETVQRFDWADFYMNYEGEAYFEWFRRQMLRPDAADIILIDSRTGVAEMSGVCTRQLADMIVVLCAPNDQNLDGVAHMAESFKRPDVIAARGGRDVQMLMVPARLDISEGRPVDLFAESFRSKLEQYAPDFLRRLGTGYSKLRIPYISAYAYAERLAVGDPDGVTSLQDAYATLATHIAALAPAVSPVKTRLLAEIQQTFGLATVHLVHVDEEGRAQIPELQRKLDAAGLMTIVHDEPETAVERVLQAQGRQHSMAIVANIGTNSAMFRAREIYRRSRQQGLNVVLVGKDGANPRPRWAAHANIYNPETHFEQLVAVLQTPPAVGRVPFMVPPPPEKLIGRADEYVLLKTALLSYPSVKPVGLVGQGGIGKSTLARAVCNDDDIVDFYEDGVFWAFVGPQPDFHAILTGFLIALQGENVRPAATVEEAGRLFAEAVGAKHCLIVLDDIWQPSHISRFSNAGPQCQLLVTTRAQHLPGVEGIRVGALSREAAEELARQYITGKDVGRSAVQQLTELLGSVPLAIEVATRALRSRIELGESPARALNDIIEEISEEGLDALETAAGESMTAFFRAGIERLDPTERARLPLLARVPAGREVSIDHISQVLNLAEREAERMLRRLAEMSILEIDPQTRTVRIPTLTLQFVRTLEIREQRAAGTRRATESGGKSGIFISYRGDDTRVYAGRLYDRLLRHFGTERILMDIDSIAPGQDFRATVEEAVRQAAVVVVLIGPKWLRPDENGRRRLDDPSDFVRTEIETALRSGVPVLPVLISGAKFPGFDELPEAIQPLAYRNALEIDDRFFNDGVDSLAMAIEQQRSPRPAAASEPVPEAAMPRSARRSSRFWAGLAAAVVVLALAAALRTWNAPAAPQSPPGQQTGVNQDGSTRPPDAVITPPTKTENRAKTFFEEAEAYYVGRARRQDYSIAATLYRQAADLGFAPAQERLGHLYELGQGVPKSRDSAIAWYRKAAEQNYAPAQDRLNSLIRTGGRALPDGDSGGARRLRPQSR